VTPVDWGILAVLLFSTVTALVRGLLLEVFSLVGLIVGVFVAGWQYDNCSPPLMHFGLSRNVADAIAFLVIAFGVAIAVSLIGRLLRGVVRGVGLGWVDRLLGAAFGLLRGLAVVVIAVMASAAFFPGAEWMRDSRLLPYFIQASHPVEQWFPAVLRDKLSVGRMWIDPVNKPAR
jgi:membrane protein required for colicin V production